MKCVAVMVWCLCFCTLRCIAQPADRAEWESRRDSVLPCIASLMIDDKALLVTAPAIKSGPRNYNGYSVHNIALETVPGIYVSASVYQPLQKATSMPAVLVPNGHFYGGRYRADIQYICASLARMGSVAISYDLFGWGESRLQVKDEDHYTATAMHIQRLNTTRIINYLLTQKNIDTARIAITGASGGGSQTMLTAALDNRIKVSVPVVMLSASYPGGCPCEVGIPIHQCANVTNNLEIAAAAAPRPQLVISCGKDWTTNVPKMEYPYLQKIYGLYGKKELVNNVHLPDEGHDYGINKRKAMYRFMAKHLRLNIKAISNTNGEIDESGAYIEDESVLLSFGYAGELLPANALKNIAQVNKLLSTFK